MADLLALSSRIIDSGLTDQPVNRVSNELSEIAPGVALVESFSHCVALDTDEGLVCFDASGVQTGKAVRASLRAWRDAPVSHLVYTHGHADHIGGSMFFGEDQPTVIGHENVATRMDRYEYTNAWNLIINARQFGGVSGDLNVDVGDSGGGVEVKANPGARRFLPSNTLRPAETFSESHDITVGGHRIEMHHARGETDDHLWAWMPEHKAVVTGDFLIWNFPNAGNPQKVQRYPIEWAAALRRMVAMRPELLLPAHGLPIEGKERIARVLDDVATALEDIVRDVVAMMNAGATLDTIIHTVRVPAETLAKPYLRPLYDEPEFVVRGIWRQFGGWWDGAAATEAVTGWAPGIRVGPACRRGRRAAAARRAGRRRRRHAAGLPPRRPGRLGSARRPRHPRWPGRHLPGPAQGGDQLDEQGHLRRCSSREPAGGGRRDGRYWRLRLTSTSASAAAPRPTACHLVSRSPSMVNARATVLAG
jgi:glyoxylase-like metal-dependent hydrolase (beta-lactamase superfamily II)